eukprot:CAMPEP_0118975250 /NCGR_PEP_ID=MMETSP1173-20130426/15168_1 /TAXON_ID=1034831 /ORGANISM="Rhizochromulina marina cf, Strain CCMP1243" /LENGTH=296 /DNA_ID=CAMNT_0006925109 /DNA_START=68 /DNA_END=955 /DNA_ORIENTATION=-
MEKSLRFDEFRALRERRRTTDEHRGQREQHAEETGGRDKDGAEVESRAQEAGNFFESFDIQVLTLCFIFVDVAAATALVALSGEESLASSTTAAVLNVIQSLMGFTIFYFILELAALAWAFKTRFLTHAGILVDMGVVACAVLAEVQGTSRIVRVLGVLRVWRLMRLINTVMATKDKEIDSIREEWQADQARLEESQITISRLEDSIRREGDAKKRVEDMLKSYKDEVETLNEALKIAALDIAAAASEQLQSDEEAEKQEAELKPVPATAAGAPHQRRMVVKADGTYSVSTSGEKA